MDVWGLASVLSKSLIYAGMLALIGGVVVLAMAHTRISLRQPSVMQTLSRQYLLPVTLTALLATCFNFLVQIGFVNQRGIAGMFDPMMGSILAGTEVGAVLRWRLAGFFAALLALLPLHLPGYPFQHWVARRFSLIMALLAATCFTFAVATQGHASAVSMLAQLLAAAHLLAIACWAGALYPLSLWLVQTAGHAPGSSPDLAADADWTADITAVLYQFGRYGWLMLGVMLSSGIGLIWLLTGGLLTLFDNLHGQLLLIKLLLVTAMMALGALHKFSWVPRLRAQLDEGGDTQRHCLALARSIRLETLLAVLVLLLTAALTTLTGPFD
ncbi:MAG: CopD family protein [Gammaproteobacteria bacterium]|nr:CopD family protein [Gammaproteobacteria bacterium]